MRRLFVLYWLQGVVYTCNSGSHSDGIDEDNDDSDDKDVNEGNDDGEEG